MPKPIQPTKRWIRTCQECLHKAAYKPVEEYTTDAWTEVKCRKCKSTALDYGSWDEGDD